MWPVVPSLIGAGASLIGGLFGRSGQNSANEANHREAQLNRGWQTQMANTAHTRQMADMQRAGLNPILSGMGGSGAGTGGGAQATMQNANTALSEALPQAVSSAMDARRLRKEIEQTDASNALTHANRFLTMEQQEAQRNSAEKTRKEIEILKIQAPTIKAQADLDKKQAEWDKGALDVDNITKRVSNMGSSLGSALNVGNIVKSIFGKSKSGVRK